VETLCTVDDRLGWRPGGRAMVWDVDVINGQTAFWERDRVCGWRVGVGV